MSEIPEAWKTRMALVADAIEHAFTPLFEELAKAARSLARPGSFVGDVLLVYEGGAGEVEAAQRLAETYFARRRVFHPSRWGLFEEPLRCFADEAGLGMTVAYEVLALSALFFVTRDPGTLDVSADELFPMLRRKVRVDIERAVLDGVTLDVYLARRKKSIPLPEDDEIPTNADLRQALAAELGPMADMKVSLLKQMGRLTEAERLAVLGPWWGWTDKEIAEKTGGKPSTVRQRRKRAVKKLSQLA